MIPDKKAGGVLREHHRQSLVNQYQALTQHFINQTEQKYDFLSTEEKL